MPNLMREKIGRMKMDDSAKNTHVHSDLNILLELGIPTYKNK